MNYRALIPMTEVHDPVIEGPLPEGEVIPQAEQVEPTDAPRYTAGSRLRSLVAATLDLLPPPTAIVNTTPPAAPALDAMGETDVETREP